MTILYKLIYLFSLVASALAQQDVIGYTDDPYLAFRPPFARSLPIQIMLTGIVLTLVAVLFIHLMFTAQYHWPLAPVNYVLQLSGVTTLLISLIATIHVVLSASLAESERWPYMLSYIAVNVPPGDLELDDHNNTEVWTVAEKATWLVMNASTSGLIQITHIQFLTLLYPSRLEGRLIFALLGPLAIVAAVMQLLPISGSDSVANVASAVRNVCNATLSLLFTIALFIWGLFVNRAQAWRTDGGTAVFGCAALSLAVVSTALNFLSVHKEEEYVWLPSLMWAVVLWQSFLGWWWWVGAGSGGGYGAGSSRSRERVYDDGYEAEEKMRRDAKRDERRQERRERARERGMRARRVWEGVAGAFSQSGASSGAGASATGASVIADDAPPRRRRRRDDDDERSIHSQRTSMTLTISRGNTGTNSNTIPSFGRRPTTDSSSGGSITTSSLPRFLPGFMRWWYAALRREHNEAARIQAAERVERIREMESDRNRENGDRVSPQDSGAGDPVNNTGARVPQPSAPPFGGWYTFGWKKRRADDVGLARGVTQNKGKGKAKNVSKERQTRRRKERVHSESGSETASDGSGSASASEAPSREPSRERPRSDRERRERERNREHEKRRRRRAEERGEETDGVYELVDYVPTPSGSGSASRSPGTQSRNSTTTNVASPPTTGPSRQNNQTSAPASTSNLSRTHHARQAEQDDDDDDMYVSSSSAHSRRSETETEVVQPPPRGTNRVRDRDRDRDRDDERRTRSGEADRERERDRHRDRRRRERDVEDVERGIEGEEEEQERAGQRRGGAAAAGGGGGGGEAERRQGGGRSLWWWGPLSRWRLQDSTTY